MHSDEPLNLNSERPDSGLEYLMNYKPRPGIVKVKLCGMNVLVPSREASAYCTSLYPLSTLWNATWEAFGRGTTIEKVVPVHALLTKKSPEECREKLEQFCRTMVEKGFFLEVSDEDHIPEQAADIQSDE